ncbi:hypothetical protein, partial [Deinococcus sonorensis]
MVRINAASAGEIAFEHLPGFRQQGGILTFPSVLLTGSIIPGNVALRDAPSPSRSGVRVHILGNVADVRRAAGASVLAPVLGG